MTIQEREEARERHEAQEKRIRAVEDRVAGAEELLLERFGLLDRKMTEQLGALAKLLTAQQPAAAGSQPAV